MIAWGSLIKFFKVKKMNKGKRTVYDFFGDF